ncbi:hypothetical protein C0389_06805 [bacterium]|nr:hypothetical protein [bacterium]
MKKSIFIILGSMIVFSLIYANLFSYEMGTGSGSSYPTTLDTDNTVEFSTDYAREQVPNDSNAAIIKIENELGILPKGVYSTVKDRLVDVQKSTGTLVKKSGDIMSGYLALGSNAPKIKMVKLSTTTSSVAYGIAQIAHGLTKTKIMSVSVLVNQGDDYLIDSTYGLYQEGFSFYWRCTLNSVAIFNKTNNESSLIFNKPVTILVTYEE